MMEVSGTEYQIGALFKIPILTSEVRVLFMMVALKHQKKM